MNDIEKIIHRIRLCRTSQAKQLLCDFLKLLPLDSESFERIKAVIWDSKYPHWHNFYNIVNKILEGKSICTSDVFSFYCDKIQEAIKSRMKYEDEISQILPLAQRKYAFAYSHYNEYRYACLIRRLVNLIAKEELIEDANKRTLFHQDRDIVISKDVLDDTVRLLYRIADRRYYEKGIYKYIKLMDYLQALEASLQIRIKRTIHNKHENFCGFRMCDVCWRFAAYSEGQLCRCDRHIPGINTRDYQKATAIYNLVSKRKGVKSINYMTYGFIDKIRAVFGHYESTELYYAPVVSRAGSEDALTLLQSIPSTPNRDKLAELMHILSRTRKYIEKQGGNPCEWESVIETLDPSPVDEPEPYKNQRQMLHSALCRDPTPFQLNLAFCEAWLRLHNVKYSLAGRGGARPNAGGRRPGAGRPSKKVSFQDSGH